MASKDFISSNAVRRAIIPQVTAAGATVNGDEIDTKGWRWAHFALQLGTVAATADGTFKLQGTDTSGSGYADIVGATTAVADTDDDAVKRISLHLDQMPRYIRAVFTGGTGGTSPSAATVVLYGCADTTQYLDGGAGGADEVHATVLFETA